MLRRMLRNGSAMVHVTTEETENRKRNARCCPIIASKFPVHLQGVT